MKLFLIDVSIPGDHRVKTVGPEEKFEYIDLKECLLRSTHPKCFTATVVPFVIGALCEVTTRGRSRPASGELTNRRRAPSHGAGGSLVGNSTDVEACYYYLLLMLSTN
jgi:hypothetical protein